MAIVGVPYKYLRCGVCLFGEENFKPKLDLKDVVNDWNESVRAYAPLECGTKTT